LGAVTSFQVVPSQCSMRLTALSPSGSLAPAAHPLLAEVMVTLLRLDPRGSGGAATVVQVLPFQCSISAWPESSPTAQTLLAEVAVTAYR
jgi:hypothetical protein